MRTAIAIFALAACGKGADKAAVASAAAAATATASGSASASAAPAPTFKAQGTGTIYVDLPGTRSIEDAVHASLKGAPGFDARPSITGGFADKDGKKGGATFTAQIGGKPVKGQILVGVDDKGATAAIVYAAPQTGPQLTTTQLQGGSGAVGVPAGWTLTASTQFGGATIDGPEQQRVQLGLSAEVVDPNSQTGQMMRQYGQTGAALMAPFEAPDKAFVDLSPQFNRMAASAGMPTETIDQVLDVQPFDTGIPGALGADVTVATTRHEHGTDSAFKSVLALESIPVGNGGWMFYVYALGTAPAAIYDRDLPSMIASIASWQQNAQVIDANTQAAIRASNARFQAMEASIASEQRAFDGYLASVQQGEDERERSNADFDEVIRGYRAVEDTTTGDRTYVNLGDVGDIVDKLDEADPGRYQQIPLRDE